MDGNPPAKSPVVSWKRLFLQAAFLLVFCVSLIYLHPVLIEGDIQKLDTPQTAMDGSARVKVEDFNGLLFLTFAAGLGVVGFLYWRNPSLCRLSVIPALGSLPLYYSCRQVADRVESVPAFHENVVASECELLDFARTIQDGGEPAVPAQVGKFQVIRYEVLGTGAVVLYTHGYDWASRPQFWGFVWYPDQAFTEAYAKAVGITGDAGDYHRVSRLHVDWYVLYHHYWYIKRGWS